MKLSRFENVANIAGVDDWYDAWGTALSLHFDICDVLHIAGGSNDALQRWDYHPGARQVFDTVESLSERFDSEYGYSEGEFAGDYSYGVMSLCSALHNKVLTVDDLVYAGDVLERYAAVLRSAGKDY